jgi:CRISPR-associated endonuclease/helicase Cas3
MDKNIVDVLRAKSKDQENYLLKDHLKETVLRAIKLKDFIDKNKQAITYNNFNDGFFEDLIIACFLHDLGKIDLNFQEKVFRNEKDSSDFKLIEKFFEEIKKVEIDRHEVISVIYSLIFLGNSERDKKIRTAVLFHHYNQFYLNKDDIKAFQIFQDYNGVYDYLSFLINKEGEIKELLKNLLNYISSNIENEFAKEVIKKLEEKMNFDLIRKLRDNLDKARDVSTVMQFFEIPYKEDEHDLAKFYDFFVFLGCLRRCDYSASGEVEIEKDVNLDEIIYKGLDEKIKNRLNVESLWQEKIIEQIKTKDKKNIVLIAPTGSGKTEFALLWAKENKKKLIYTLPLRVALNDLYLRFHNENGGYFESDFLGILHSTSFLEYLNEEKLGKPLDIDEKKTTAALFSYPLTLTTSDQVFLSSLKYYGFDKLISVYPTSSIVVDEIQTYNPEMAAIIIKTLKIIEELNGSILIMTATFPPYFREFIKDNEYIKIDLERVDEEIKNQVKNYNIKRHKIKVLDFGLFLYDDGELKINEQSFKKVKEILTQEENKDKNILIILNNVGKAIKIFEELEKDNEIKKRVIKNLNNEEIPLLLHSRIIEKEKSERIRTIKEALKSGEKGMILVSTQIVEASVDIDFDLLITEASPIDSQIQRWGRIYRNRKSHYDEDSPNILILADIDNIDKGTSAIYDRRVVEKTIEILRQNQEKILDYKDERELIEKVFEQDINGKKLNDVFINEIRKNLEWLEYVSSEKRSEAQRIFRRIAGVQVVIPDLMSKDDEIERAFAEVLLEDKKNWKLPFESTKNDSIVKKVKEKVGDSFKEKVTKWKLLEILYNYSFNLPIFSFDRYRYKILERENFKGFFVLKLDKDKIDLMKIKRYGIDKIDEKIKDINFDRDEIQAVEYII